MEKTKDEPKRTRCEREVEVNSARIFFRASNMRSITSVAGAYSFFDSGEGSRSN